MEPPDEALVETTGDTPKGNEYVTEAWKSGAGLGLLYNRERERFCGQTERPGRLSNTAEGA